MQKPPPAAGGEVSLHNFSAQLWEQLVHFHVMRLTDSLFLWVGATPHFRNLAVAMCSRYVSVGRASAGGGVRGGDRGLGARGQARPAGGGGLSVGRCPRASGSWVRGVAPGPLRGPGGSAERPCVSQGTGLGGPVPLREPCAALAGRPNVSAPVIEGLAASS